MRAGKSISVSYATTFPPFLGGTGVTKLPDNLEVGGDLYLRGTGVTKLPDNLEVGGSLDLRGTGVTKLPDNLEVGGFLDLGGTGVTKLPDNLEVGGKVYGFGPPASGEPSRGKTATAFRGSKLTF